MTISVFPDCSGLNGCSGQEGLKNASVTRPFGEFYRERVRKSPKEPQAPEKNPPSEEADEIQAAIALSPALLLQPPQEAAQSPEAESDAGGVPAETSGSGPLEVPLPSQNGAQSGGAALEELPRQAESGPLEEISLSQQGAQGLFDEDKLTSRLEKALERPFERAAEAEAGTAREAAGPEAIFSLRTEGEGSPAKGDSGSESGLPSGTGEAKSPSSTESESLLSGIFPRAAAPLESRSLETADAESVSAVTRALDMILDDIRSIESGDSRHLTIQLEPESLGKLSISLTLGEEGLTARLTSADSEIRNLLSSELGGLVTALKNSGIAVESLEVTDTGLWQQDFSGRSHQERYGRQQPAPPPVSRPRAAGDYEVNQSQIQAAPQPREHSGYIDYRA